MAALLGACADAPFAFALEGFAADSWACAKSFLGFAPAAVLRVAASGAAEIEEGGRRRVVSGDPLDLLQQFVADFHSDPLDCDDEYGFVVAALSYDLRTHIERLRSPRPIDPGAILLHAAAYDWLLVFDAVERRFELCRRPGADVDLAVIADELQRRANRVAAVAAAPGLVRLVPEFTAASHAQAMAQALSYIRAGDIYQVNLAQRFCAEGRVDPVALFATLQRTHPVPFGAFLDMGCGVLVANSPECLLRVDDRAIATYPIKGTRRRAAGAAADLGMQRELISDPKERAEHVMIVDLERNDLGRVCEVGTVAVRELLRVETFPSLHHLVSKVQGRLRETTGLAEILRAVFPGGSITGAPKIRAMEIIDEIEPCARGFYTGSIGLLGPRWSRLNIAIRTAFVTPERLVYHAGGGIVADSDPRREYEEILLKTQALATALQASAA